MKKTVEMPIRVYENKTKGEKTYYTIMVLDGEQEIFVANVFKTRYNHKFIDYALAQCRKKEK